MCAEKRGAWAEIAKAMYAQHYDTRYGFVLKESYRSVLLRYEFEQAIRKEEEESQKQQEVSQKQQEEEEEEGGVKETAQHLDQLMTNLLRTASIKERQLATLRHSPGEVFDSVKEKLRCVQREVREGAAGDASGSASVVLLFGRNGVGKSMLIQNLVRLCEPSQCTYQESVKYYEEEAVLHEAEVYAGKLLGRECAELHPIKPGPEFDQRLPFLRQRDDEAGRVLRSYCEGKTRSLQGLEPFLLPTGNLRTSTTATSTHVCYGRQYQAMLVFKDEEEIIRELEGYNWGHAEELLSSPEGFGDEKAKMEYEYVKVWCAVEIYLYARFGLSL